jgi:hypothetical protein
VAAVLLNNVGGTMNMTRRRYLTVGAVAAVILLSTSALALRRSHTTYAAGFTHAAFAELPFLASASTVERHIGKPLTVRHEDLLDTWSYCLSQPEPITIKRGLLLHEMELPTEGCPEIRFGTNGVVVDVGGFTAEIRASLVGRSREEVARAVGVAPVQRRGGKYSILYYSRPSVTEDTFEQVTVTLDPDGRLVSKNTLVVPD